MIRWIIVILLCLLALLTAVSWVISIDGMHRWVHVSPDGLVLGLLPPRDTFMHIVLWNGRVGITHKTPVPPTGKVPYWSFKFCGLLLEARPSARPVGLILWNPNFDPEAFYLKHRKLERYVGIPL